MIFYILKPIFLALSEIDKCEAYIDKKKKKKKKKKNSDLFFNEIIVYMQ